MFSEYFSNNSTVNNAQCNFTYRENIKTLFLQPVTNTEIFNVLIEVSKKPSAGLDSIPCNVLRYAAGYIADPLEFLINLSFSRGCFPSALKCSKLVPVYKKGKRDIISNYRPISVLSCFSKVFEKVMSSRLYEHFDRNNLFAPSQFGYLNSKSINNALFSLLTSVYDLLDSKQRVGILMFDLSHAFDTVDHNLLLNKLDQYGVRGIANNWIKSYLLNRTQTVAITCNNRTAFSSPLTMKSGIPQGSVLGPLLFLIYANDLVTNFESEKVCQFADDTTAVFAHNTIQSLSLVGTECANKMLSWTKANSLELNSAKTKLIIFDPRKSCSESTLIKLSGRSIPECTSAKFLGCEIDKYLNWVNHINGLCSRINSSLYALRILRQNVDSETCLVFYRACIESRLRFGIIAWGCSSNMNRLFIAQKKTLRVIFRLKNRESCRQHFIDSNILSLPSLYLFECAMYAKINLDNFTKNSVYNKTYSTRGGDDLSIPLHKSNLYEKSPYYNCVRVFNRLPMDIRRMHRTDKFKVAARKFFLDKCFYKIVDFLL